MRMGWWERREADMIRQLLAESPASWPGWARSWGAQLAAGVDSFACLFDQHAKALLFLWT